jgi:hypothetical protein
MWSPKMKGYAALVSGVGAAPPVPRRAYYDRKAFAEAPYDRNVMLSVDGA